LKYYPIDEEGALCIGYCMSMINFQCFILDEVRNVVSVVNGDKALGPDEFSMAFFQACWDVLSSDIMAVFNDFHARSWFEKSLNA